MVGPIRRATVRRMSTPSSVVRSVQGPVRGSRRASFRVSIPTILGLVSAVIAIGCDRNIEDYRPGEEARPPDLARIFPGPAPGPGEQASGQSDRGAVPPTRAEGTRTGMEGAGAGAPPAELAGGAPAPIQGEIDLAPELAMARPDGGVLFVIARPQGVRAGPPLAVLRIPSPRFPLAFSIGPDDVMIPSMRFEGAISLSARLDADGNAMTRQPGDISSPVEEPLAPGTTGVRLLLSERG